MSDRDQVEAAVSRIAGELGAPTVLVNNAGVLRDNLLFKMTNADWADASRRTITRHSRASTSGLPRV